MIKIMVAAVATLLLAGCATTPVILRSNQNVVYTPDQTKFRCDALAKLPKPEGLTDDNVAILIATLYTYNRKCYMTNQALLNALQSASLEINSGGRINGSFVRKYRLVRH